MQRGCVEVLRLHGYRVWRIGQYNAARTQDSGPADLYATHPDTGCVWVEVKRPIGGRQSPAQREFEACVTAAGGTYVLTSDPAHLHTVLADLREQRRHHRP